MNIQCIGSLISIEMNSFTMKLNSSHFALIVFHNFRFYKKSIGFLIFLYRDFESSSFERQNLTKSSAFSTQCNLCIVYKILINNA